MEPITFVHAALRHWRLFVLLGAIGTALAYVASVTTPVQYQSTVTLQLNPAATSALLPYGSGGQETNPVSAMAASYAEVLRSRAFGDVVVRQLDLPIAPEAIAASID